MAKTPSIAAAIVSARVAAIDPQIRMKVLAKQIKLLERRLGVAATWEYLRGDSMRLTVDLDSQFGAAPPQHWAQSQESSARVWAALGDMIVEDADEIRKELNKARAELTALKAKTVQP